MRAVEHAVIAVAGLGSRLGHGMPKCMLELGGQTLLSRLIATIGRHVNRIHIVVGYREELVINLCANLHRDVVIVRNPHFRNTTTVQSMAMGAQGLDGKTLFLDGDLIIDPHSLSEFLNQATKHSILAAITPTKSENAVGVETMKPRNQDCGISIGGFTMKASQKYEWANVVAGPARMLDGATGYVYEKLEEHLPLNAAFLELCEIDTASDLELAKEFAKNLVK